MQTAVHLGLVSSGLEGGGAEVHVSGTVGRQRFSLGGFGWEAVRDIPASRSLTVSIFFFRLIISCAEDVSRTAERGMSSQIQR